MTRTAPLLLVVDDDDDIARILTSELTEAGYEAVRAADGREGLQLFKRCHPDLVLTDDVMPHLDGFGLIEAIRRLKQTPIIMISERGGDRDRIRALGLGADPGHGPGPGRRSSPQARSARTRPAVHRHRAMDRLSLCG